MSGGFESTLIETEEDDAGTRRLLIIISPDGVSQTHLPASGELTVGRDPKCEVVLMDPLISREHARLRVGRNVTIEDLGSANGTRIAQTDLKPKEPATVESGQPVELGSSLLVVQRARSAARTFRLRSHVEFEAHLEQACRTRGADAIFALVRVRVLGEAPVDLVQSILTESLGSRDAIGAFAPGEYELLLQDTARRRADAVARRFEESFEAKGYGANVGVAMCPADGGSADALLARAGERMTEADDDAGSAPVVVSGAMRDLYALVERVAAGDIGVLFHGETGVGKKVLAEHLHAASPRRDAPCLRINCAAYAEPVLESELFGHEAGAFAGAHAVKAGVLEQAAGGTVLLQEIAELPLATQGKLVQALENRRIMRVGGVQTVPVNVRFVATSSRDLEVETQRGGFREDLYYRLAGVSLRVPPLRERPEDVVPLAERFVRRFSAEQGRPPPDVGPPARQLLERYAWPGNVRELRNAMERAVLLCAFGLIEPEHLPLDKLSTGWTSGQSPSPAPAVDDDPEKARILAALQACGGNQTKAAAQLGVSRRTLTKWLNRYADIPRPRK